MIDPHVPPQVRETHLILLELATRSQRGSVAYFAACPETNKNVRLWPEPPVRGSAVMRQVSGENPTLGVIFGMAVGSSFAGISVPIATLAKIRT